MAEGSTAAPSAAPAGQPASPAPQQGQPVASGAKPGETAAQTQARMLKLMLDGQEVELPESQVVANFRKGKDAAQLLSKVEQKRLEALKAKSEAEGLLNRLKQDPRGVLRELGLDMRKLSEETILEAIELEKMTPAERRAYEAEKRVREMEAERDKVKKSEEEKAHAAEVERHKDEFANLFLGTMEKLGLPKSSARYVIPRMAQLYAQNEQAGLESSPEEMAEWVMQGLQAEHRGVLSGLDGEALLERLGDDVVRKVQTAVLARFNAKRKAGGAQPAQTRPAQQPAQPMGNVDPRKGRWALIESQYLGK